MIQPLALADQSQSNTNLSTSRSLSILDQYGNEFPIEKNFQLIISRDPNLIIPSMILQNVTSSNLIPHQFLFYLHHVDITSANNLPISVHFEMHPLNTNLVYLLIYKFDTSSQLNSSINQIDGWTLFCPPSK
jgi:hypothetical protein